MGLIKDEIRELRQLIRDYDDGKVKPEEVHTKVAIYKEVGAREKFILQAATMIIKHGSSIYTHLVRENLLSVEPKKIIEKNPCLECKFKNEDKNRPECEQCADRAAYLIFLDGKE